VQREGVGLGKENLALSAPVMTSGDADQLYKSAWSIKGIQWAAVSTTRG
jgi:hypothetical protein